MATFKKVAFTMYPAKDLGRARTFYEKTLGLGKATEMGGGRWIEFDLPQGGCLAITDMVPGIEPSSTAGGSVAFEVDDIRTVVSDLKAKDVAFKMDLFESPVCHMAVCLDTEGNAVTLHQLKQR